MPIDDLISTVALTLGAGWASGINLYAVILVLGLLGAAGYVDLPAGLAMLSDPLVISAAALMYFIVALALFCVLLIWLLPRIWHGVRRVFGAIARFVRGARGPAGAPPTDEADRSSPRDSGARPPPVA